MSEIIRFKDYNEEVNSDVISDASGELVLENKGARNDSIVNTSKSSTVYVKDFSELKNKFLDTYNKKYSNAYKAGGHAFPEIIGRLRLMTMKGTSQIKKEVQGKSPVDRESGGKIVEYTIYTPTKEDVGIIVDNAENGKSRTSNLKPYQLKAKISNSTGDWRTINLRGLMAIVLDGTLYKIKDNDDAKKIKNYADKCGEARHNAIKILRDVMMPLGFTEHDGLHHLRSTEDEQKTILDLIINNRSEAEKIRKDKIADEIERKDNEIAKGDASLASVTVKSFRRNIALVEIKISIRKLVKKLYGYDTLVAANPPENWDGNGASWKKEVKRIKEDLEKTLSKNLGKAKLNPLAKAREWATIILK